MINCYIKYLLREKVIRRARRQENVVSIVAQDEEATLEELLDLELYRPISTTLATENKLQRYIEQDRVPWTIDIYQYQKAKQFDYPTLARIAKDYLVVLATLAPSECVFSQGANIVSKKRNKLTGESIRMLICMKDWGLVIDEDIDSDSDIGGEAIHDQLHFLDLECWEQLHFDIQACKSNDIFYIGT